MLLITLAISIVEFAIIDATLFISAGPTDLPMFWSYLVAFAMPGLITAVVVTQPDHVEERMQSSEDNRDKLSVPIAAVLALLHFIIAGLDIAGCRERQPCKQTAVRK
jgi:hypothetical protein